MGPGPAALLAAVLGATAGAPPRLDVVSDSSCPDATTVRAVLHDLGGSEAARPARVGVRARPDRLVLEFQWEGEGAIDIREIPAPNDCAERAKAAAVVAAAWLGVLPASPATAPPLPAPPLPPSPSPPATSVTPASPLAAAPVTTEWWLGVGLGAGAGGGVAPGARVELARLPARGHRWGWQFSAQGTLPRERTIGGGTSSWVRPALGLAGTAVWQGDRLGVAADLGWLGGATFAWGSGYPSNSNDVALSLGLAAGVRVLLSGGRSIPWLDVRVARWLTAHRLLVDSSAGTAGHGRATRLRSLRDVGMEPAGLLRRSIERAGVRTNRLGPRVLA